MPFEGLGEALVVSVPHDVDPIADGEASFAKYIIRIAPMAKLEATTTPVSRAAASDSNQDIKSAPSPVVPITTGPPAHPGAAGAVRALGGVAGSG